MNPRAAFLFVALGAFIACARDKSATVDSAAAAPPFQPAIPVTLTLENFRNLRFLEGAWRGVMSDGATFYESYRHVDDSTIAALAFTDSTLRARSDSSTITLRAGTASLNGSQGARWVITRLDSTGVTFSPSAKAVNSFTWSPSGADAWQADISFPEVNRAARHVRFDMRRMAPAKSQAR